MKNCSLFQNPETALEDKVATHCAINVCSPPADACTALSCRRKTPFSGRFLLFIVVFLMIGRAFVWGGDTIEPAVSVSVQPYAHWLYFPGLWDDPGKLNYEIEPSMFTTLEFSLKYKDWLNFGFGFDYKQDANYVDEIIDSKLFSRLMGQIGMKKFALRASWGQLQGNAVWEGNPVPGQPDTALVDTKYYEIALLYYFTSWTYTGVNYQNYHIPIALDYGYDDDVQFDYYGVYIGMSTFKYFMDEWKEYGDIFQASLWLEQNGSLGIAMGNISEEGRRRDRFGKLISFNKSGSASEQPSSMAFSGSGQVIAGLFGGINFDVFFLGFGAGYDGFIQFYTSSVYTAVLIRHGFVVRAYCSF
jgi:hypothetical protein